MVHHPSSSAREQDHIKINKLLVEIPLAASLDGIPKPRSLQKTRITVDIHSDTSLAARYDNVGQSIDYSTVASKIRRICTSESNGLGTIKDVADAVVTACSTESANPVEEVIVQVEFLDPLKNVGAIGIQVRSLEGPNESTVIQNLFISNVHILAIVGLNPSERIKKQPVIINVGINHAALISVVPDFDALTSNLIRLVEKSSYVTVEKMTEECARLLLSYFNDKNYTVTVRVAKPEAIKAAESAEIMITRSLADYMDGALVLRNSTARVMPSRAAIAIGSNIGDRFQNIETALRMLEQSNIEKSVEASDEPNKKAFVAIVDTSFMYETSPMYVVDQPCFVNCACLVETNLDPTQLLAFLKRIEKNVGRIPSVRFGPRAIDLDIVSYGDVIFDTRSEDEQSKLDNLENELVIPHPRMVEREFVLRPLNDIIPDWVHPHLHLTVRDLLYSVAKRNDDVMMKVVPFPLSTPDENANVVPLTSTYWTFPISTKEKSSRPYLMATLNVTPDSFSDGSLHLEVSRALEYCVDAAASGANILDIGGYSTRPNAPFVSVEDEIQRVVPVIEAIRQGNEKLKSILISVDTFRWEVAQAAILAGANCINDVYAFTGLNGYKGPLEPMTQETLAHFDRMKAIARKYAVPIIMMHSRGDAGSNKDYSMYKGMSSKPILQAVRLELGDKINKVMRGAGGVRRWNIFIDPGIGFSKTLEDNLDLLRHASEITADIALIPRVVSAASSAEVLGQNALYSLNPLAGFPLLIGCSRKSFLGVILSQSFQPGVSSSVEADHQPDAHAGRQTQPKERNIATAVAVACAVQEGATVLRVHDVQEMADAIRTASALWR